MCADKELLENIFEKDSNKLKAYITQMRGVDKLACDFQKVCLDMVITHIPERFEGFSFHQAYFYDVTCTSDIKQLEKALIEQFSVTWWETYATNLFCKAISEVPNLRLPFLDTEDLEQLVNAKTKFLKSVFYKYVQVYYVQTYFKKEYESLLQDTKSAREHYSAILKSHTAIHELWYAYGEWNHPEMEIYFHIIKLLAIGMPVEEVDSFLQTLKENGLEVPKTLLHGNWQTNTCYMFGKSIISSTDLRDCFWQKVTKQTFEPLARFVQAVGPIKQ